ncbi:MAG: VCBS repeat-containing protein, partial [Planctomycetota bacterium]
FDGDGRPDVACLARLAPGDQQGFVQLWLASDAGLVPAERAPIGLAASELVAADLDGDGADDLLVASQNTHNVDVLLNGSVRLRRQPSLGAGLGCIALAVGDLTGNGKPDIVVANAFSHDLSAIYNP